MIDCSFAEVASARPGPGHATRSRSASRVARSVVLAAGAMFLGGCTFLPSSGAPSVRPEPVKASRVSTAGASGQIMVRVPRPNFASPASVATSFFVAWASVDSVHDGPDTELVRCASLVTPALESQLSTYEVSPYEWQVMREDRLVSTVHVQTVTHPVAAPAPTRTRVYLSIYAERVTVSTSGRTVTSAGISVEMIRDGKRWLVASILYY